MRKFAFLVLFSFLCHSSGLLAQYEVEVGESFGIDILPVVINLGGGSNAFEELELLYRANNENGKQLRLKGSINNRAVVADEVVYAISLNQLCGGEAPWLYNRYFPTRNFHLAAGMARYFVDSPFPLYYGMDVNFGLFRGRVETHRERCGENDNLLSEITHQEDAFSYMLGLTPVLGTELSLNKLRLVVEFGLTANYNFGKHPYRDENQQPRELNISRTDLLLNKFLNDLAIVYRF